MEWGQSMFITDLMSGNDFTFLVHSNTLEKFNIGQSQIDIWVRKCSGCFVSAIVGIYIGGRQIMYTGGLPVRGVKIRGF